MNGSEKQTALYFDCNSGISGDMAVASLLDLLSDSDERGKNLAGRGENDACLENLDACRELEKVLVTIPASGFKTKITRVKKSTLDCLDFAVILDKKHENHDHDMKYFYSASEDDGHCISHHEHRNLFDVFAIIDKTQMSENAHKISHKIFEILANAESKAHGIPIEQVHFHEVGAIDSIVDVIAFSVCFDNLCTKYSIKKVYVPYLAEGYGTVRCQHGVLPIPVPAVVNIVSEYGIPLKMIDEKGEFVTPTGASFVAAVATDYTMPFASAQSTGAFKIKKVGLGAGKREYNRPCFVRAMLIENSLECD